MLSFWQNKKEPKKFSSVHRDFHFLVYLISVDHLRFIVTQGQNPSQKHQNIVSDYQKRMKIESFDE